MKNTCKRTKRYLTLSNLILFSFTFISCLSSARGVLETPALRSPNSGIATISGWHCTSNDIEVYIDGKSFGQAGTSTLREDTAEVCGHTSTGFSLLVNYGAFEDGAHTVRVLADGELLEQRLFFTTQIAGEGVEYARGLRSSTTVNNFPNPGEILWLQWVEDQQNFVAQSRSKVDLKRKGDNILFIMNGSFVGTQRMYSHTGGKLTDLNRIDFDISMTESTFSMNFNDPELGECTFDGDVKFNFFSGPESSGNYTCGGREGTYTATANARQIPIPHIVFIHQVGMEINLDARPFSPENRVIILQGQAE